MKIVTFSHAGRVGAGALLDSGRAILDFTASTLDLPQPGQHNGWFDLDGPGLRAAMALLESSGLEDLRRRGAVLDRADADLLVVVEPPE